MVLRYFSSIKLTVDFKPKIDNIVFRLHYKYTYMLFMCCVLLTTLYDWVGKSIECMIDTDSDPLRELVNSWCFIMGTFTVQKHYEGEVGKDVPHSGVGPSNENDEITIHSYYQWVPFVLFFQGVLFYLPHWVWKGWEGGFFQNVIMDLSIRDYLGNNLENYENRGDRYAKLAKYLKDHFNCQKSWAYKFFFCEGLNLCVSVIVFVFTDWFLAGQFATYGIEVFKVIHMDPENRTDPMYMVFPRMAKCTFDKFGPSGTIEIMDVMCLIATNVVNEKIYLCLWIWLVFIMTITAAWLLIRLCTMFCPRFRYFLLKRKASRALDYEVQAVLERANVSDWFLIYNLGRNMDVGIFSEFIRFLAREFDEPAGAQLNPSLD